ncbi:lipoprotein-releasing ABC transporter permease subunit [Roseococcus pinisoli]|uniref:Lipoprotein-releasing ABC transporter permease subunit n=1 Tax=Roseococcus pinisoli TaxID=2835040 RepID=A0ABS5QGK1_9PROT|nr:lipoprotein-releasing ABC transporter permease subunit [Roseococcus pinisoli]MBS7812794.1 lipoprotein-releasing ABC transporter permease subunit [Roseococcus pinisoli]
MFGTFERTVAMRYLMSRKSDRFTSIIGTFSLVGIMLGVATLIIVLSVMGGFRQELLGRILGLNGHMGIYAADRGNLRDFDAITNTIRGVPGVVAATPIVEGQVLLSGEGNSATGGLARGIRPEDLRAKAIIANNIRAGSLDQFQGEDAVAIGTRLAYRLGLNVGDKITLISPQGRATVIGTIPRLRAYTVVALFEVGMNEYDSTYVFMPLPAAQIYFQTGNAATQVEVFVQDPTRVRAVNREIRAALTQPVRIIDWQDSNSSFFAAVQVERNVMFLILTLIIIVAAFNIISTLIMLVKDKGKDIAVLRTMGATSGSIMRIFLMCGAWIGVLGTFAGFVLGVLFCENIESIRQFVQWIIGQELFSAEIYFLTQLPAVLNWNEVGQVVGLALSLALLATIYPSWRAAKTDPVEMLRNE